MDAIDNMINYLETLKKNQGEIINTCIKEMEGEVIAMNTRDQLFNRGINAKGAKIVPGYKPATLRLKKRTGLPLHVTLFQTGRWHGKFLIKYGKSWIDINAPAVMVKKYNLTAGLKKRYGENVFGLTEQNLDKVRKRLADKLISKI